jgi:excisionase family DNA binding protein
MELPEPIYQLLRQVAAALHLGQGVVVMPLRSLLTTNEAAEILNVSRPHLIKQLDAGAISFERVGTHRRIRLSDLLDYKEQRDADRREALEALAHQAEDLNLDY